jgi:hypothetical protein
MSFDIYYFSCSTITHRENRLNPFTGTTEVTEVDDGLTAAERAAVRELLRRRNAGGPDEHGYYALRFADGGSADISIDLGGPGTCDSAMVVVRSPWSPQLVHFLFELGQVGNMVMVPVMEGSVPLVASEEQRQRVQARWPEAVVVRSAEELRAFLSGGLAVWQAYRDQVCG